MNWDHIEGKWTQFKGEAQRRWGKLTDDDMDQINGNKDKLVGRIQEEYGKSREEAERDVDDWSAERA